VIAAARLPPLDADALVRFLDGERERIDRALTAITVAAAADAPARFAEPLAYALSTSGKRLRPILCVAAYRAVRPREPVPEGVYRMACGLEIVHTYSLVHDDLPCMDDDDLRRGRPTVHRVFGSPAAIVAGAALLSLAVEVLLEEGEALGLATGTTGTLVAELCSAAGAEGMVGGQFLDLLAEREAVGAAGLEAIHRGKTGALLIASLRLGALAAHADEAALEALTRYGAALGLAFQIADDILDVVGETTALGKTAGRDQALHKSSYPSLHGLEGARRLARERVEEAKSALEGVSTPELLALADYVVERGH
jgi:geranylgeranyl diphosphate synthase, type II